MRLVTQLGSLIPCTDKLIRDLQSVDCQSVNIALSGMDIRQTIGWNLRKLRVEAGFSQERLALEANIDRSYVGRIERGMENVTVSALESLVGVGSMSPNFLSK